MAGKKVACKNDACKKVFVVTANKPQPVLMSKPVDVDALAAAAFSDEPKQEVVIEFIDVTCAGCDHVWKVEASRAGKNAPCPECSKINRVPLPKQAKSGSWNHTTKGPSYRKIEKLEGVVSAGDATGISQQTAQEIVRDRDSQEEPEVIRKRWIKRGVYGLLTSIVFGYAGYMLYQSRKTTKMDASISDAVTEIRDKDNGAKDPKFHALVLRASGEFRARSSTNRAETDAALNDFKAARNSLGNSAEPNTDRAMILSDIARSMTTLLGNEEEAEKGVKIAKEALIKEIRQTIDRMSPSDPEPVYELLRSLTRLFHKHKQGALAAQLAVQKFTPDTAEGQEALGVVGLELYRLGENQAAEDVLKKTNRGDATSIQVLRVLLNKPVEKAPVPKGPLPKGANPKEKDPPVVSQTRTATVLLLVFNKKLESVKAASTSGGAPTDKVRALLTAAEYAIPLDDKTSVPPEVNEWLETAAQILTGESKNTVSGWWTIRLSRLFAKMGKPDRANAVAELSTNDQTKAWAKAEALWTKFQAEPNTRGDESMLDNIGDATKLVAAAKAREILARQNASIDNSYQRTVNGWTKGTIRPFGIAGLVLGQQDRQIR